MIPQPNIKNHTLNHIYKSYVKAGGILSYEAYRKVCETYNVRVMDKIIYEGMVLNMGAHLAYLKVVRIVRQWKRVRINWKESKDYKQELIDKGVVPKSKENPEGEPWLIRYDDDEYVRFLWTRYLCRVRNKKAYAFFPTRGKVGNKTKLNSFLKENSLNHLMYDELDYNGWKRDD